MSTQAIQAELTRVRQLKRAIEAEVELLRNDMEEGKIHIRVSSDKKFREAAAKAVVEEADPSYHRQAWHYVDPVEGKIYYQENNASWTSWPDHIGFRIVSVDELFVESNDFSPAVDWDWDLIPDGAIDDYLSYNQEKREDNGDIPDWVRIGDVIAYCKDEGKEKYLNAIAKIENESFDLAIEFALREIRDEVVISITGG